MKSLSLKIVAMLCAASSAAVIAGAGMAMAQDGPPQAGPHQAGPHQTGAGGRGGPPAGFHGRGGVDPARRMQHLHDLLQITPAEDPAFQAWQAALKPSGPRGRPGPATQAATIPQRLDEGLALRAQREADFKARATATKAFYNGLTPAQQKAMNILPPRALLAMGGGLRGRGGPLAHRGRHGHGGHFGDHQDFGGPPPPR